MYKEYPQKQYVIHSTNSMLNTESLHRGLQVLAKVIFQILATTAVPPISKKDF